MEITEAQYQRIEPSLPRQRGNVSLSNLQLLNALLYVAEHGCKWRGLPNFAVFSETLEPPVALTSPRAFSYLLYPVSGVRKPSGSVLRSDGSQRLRDRGFENFHSAGLGRTE